MELNGSGEPGDDELQFRNLQRGWVTGWETFDVSPINFQPRIALPMGLAPSVSGSLPVIEEGTRVPDVGSGREFVFVMGEGFVEVFDTPTFEDPPPTDWERVSAAYEADAPPVPPIVLADIPVIDPDLDPKGTVGETSSGYPVETVEEEPVAFWDTLGDIFTTSAPEYASQWITSQFQPKPYTGAYMTPLTMPGAPSGPGAAPYAAAAALSQIPKVPIVQDQSLCAVPAAQPRYLRYNCQTGQFSKVPRRRRRRLLTSSDLKDLAALKAIVGGGAKMDGAIVQAIRR